MRNIHELMRGRAEMKSEAYLMDCMDFMKRQIPDNYFSLSVG